MCKVLFLNSLMFFEKGGPCGKYEFILMYK